MHTTKNAPEEPQSAMRVKIRAILTSHLPSTCLFPHYTQFPLIKAIYPAIPYLHSWGLLLVIKKNVYSKTWKANDSSTFSWETVRVQSSTLMYFCDIAKTAKRRGTVNIRFLPSLSPNEGYMWARDLARWQSNLARMPKALSWILKYIPPKEINTS